MKTIKAIVEDLFAEFQPEEEFAISALPASGSHRKYFRIKTSQASFIAAWNESVQENQAFIQMSKHFKSSGLPVPEVFFVSKDRQTYIQEDFGDTVLFDRLQSDREGELLPESVLNLYRAALKRLAEMQTKGVQGFDFNWCYPVSSFDRKVIIWDLNYFKYYFAKLVNADFDENALQTDFEQLADFLMQAPADYFMFRDFQSRNIMVKENSVYFIDYQGGRKGALQYDVASLLWQARADIPLKQRNELLDDYLLYLQAHIPVDVNSFKQYYDGFVLIRVLQTLGTYGYRGIFEQKAHFVLSLPMAMKNLSYILKENKLLSNYPTLHGLLLKLMDEKYQEWKKDMPEPNKLTVRVGSFSYKKGLPRDYTGHGGGHIFDCRAIHNPGRYDEYKQLTGRDKPVADFLDETEGMQEFLSAVTQIVDQSVQTYLRRNFDNLSIQFGCTGGQHRSVYAAEKIFAHLKNNYPVKLVLTHREQDF